jgi:hypothetical protein
MRGSHFHEKKDIHVKKSVNEPDVAVKYKYRKKRIFSSTCDDFEGQIILSF